jgi:hypothetical protein
LVQGPRGNRRLRISHKAAPIIDGHRHKLAALHSKSTLLG